MQRMKRVVSLFLVLVMVLSLLPVGIVHAAEDRYPYVIFAENSVTLTAAGLTVNGDIATNGVFMADAWHKNVQVEVKSDASGLIMLHDKLMTNYFTAGCVQYGGDYLYDEMNANINESMYVSGSAVFGGNVALNSKLGAASNINITAGVLNANNAVLYSKTGNIELGGSQVSVSGLIYAPNGAVRINTDNFNLNGIIIAKEVEINCTSWSNINYSHSVAELIGKGSTGSEDSGDTGDKEDKEDIIIDWNEAPDTDGDGLPDAYELEKGLNPNVADTDGDGLSDGYESLYAFTNPLEKDGDGNGIIDAEEDFDNDGLTDYEESLYNTYAIIADSDGDGLDDGEEIAYGTNPLIQDTDSDGVDDKTEIALGTDPTKADSDGDGIADGAEQLEQILDYEAETESAVKKVTVSFEAVGSDGGAGSIKNEKDNDRLSTNVVGLIGDPFEITLPDSQIAQVLHLS